MTRLGRTKKYPSAPLPSHRGIVQCATWWLRNEQNLTERSKGNLTIWVIKCPVRSQDPERSVDGGACNLEEKRTQSLLCAKQLRKLIIAGNGQRLTKFTSTPSKNTTPSSEFHPFYTISYHEVPSGRYLLPIQETDIIVSWQGSNFGRGADPLPIAVMLYMSDQKREHIRPCSPYFLNSCVLCAIKVQIGGVQGKT